MAPDDAHRSVEALLPWYATDQLDPAERAMVEQHLASCMRCLGQLSLERRMIEEFRSLAPEVETGWNRLLSRIEHRPHARDRVARAATDFWNMLKQPAFAALAAGQLALLVFAAMILTWIDRPAYHVLGQAERPSAANLIVIFDPDTIEADMRRLLDANGATLVGGPTAADAYLLRVPAKTRDLAVARLRADARVTMAEAIDGPAP